MTHVSNKLDKLSINWQIGMTYMGGAVFHRVPAWGCVTVPHHVFRNVSVVVLGYKSFRHYSNYGNRLSKVDLKRNVCFSIPLKRSKLRVRLVSARKELILYSRFFFQIKPKPNQPDSMFPNADTFSVWKSKHHILISDLCGYLYLLYWHYF